MRLATRLTALLVLALLLLPATGSGTGGSLTRTMALTCEFSLKDVPEGAELAEVWVPMPASDRFQSVSHISVDAPSVSFTQETEYGNSLAYIRVAHPRTGQVIRVTATATRSEMEPFEDALAEGLRKRFLSADALGVVDDEVRATAARLTDGRAGDFEKARAIYEHVVGAMEYDKQEPGWGKGDTRRALKVCKGNCSDFHALFISLCRATGIPARFHYGLAVPKEESGKAGPHCWATFYADGRWVPVDCSEARKHPEQREYFFGHLDENRIVLTTGRDIILSPRQHGAPLNFLIHPYAEVDGASAGVDSTFTFAAAK